MNEEVEISKAPKQRGRAKKDVGEMMVIRNQGGEIVTNEEKIKGK